ncbi:MAG TPA: DUF364 domain-containing protein [Gammaproteobacteria bacterium]|nr:DUF364 domain-containing protein [Gammaproteobacteria bacterium]
MQIVTEWLVDLHGRLDDEPVVDDVRVGVFYTAVRLSTRQVGVAFTPRELGDSVCCPKTAAAAPPAGQLIGTGAWELARYAASPHPLWRSLGVATLNALSALARASAGLPAGVLREDLDALAAAAIAEDDRVVMVGAFLPFLKKLKHRVAALGVIDRHRDALKADEHALWVPPERAAAAVRRASVLVLTGSALVEGGLEELLTRAGGARLRIMAGPTTPLWPHPFFARGIDVLGGLHVLDGPDLVTIVGEGGSGYLFEQVARKACLLGPRVVERAREAGVASR